MQYDTVFNVKWLYNSINLTINSIKMIIRQLKMWFFEWKQIWWFEWNILHKYEWIRGKNEFLSGLNEFIQILNEFENFEWKFDWCLFWKNFHLKFEWIFVRKVQKELREYNVTVYHVRKLLNHIRMCNVIKWYSFSTPVYACNTVI